MRSLILLVVAATAVGQADIMADVELLRSIRNDDEAVIRSLLDRGADVNAKDTHGATALMHAALYARPAIVKLLLERRADPNRVNTSGATALMWAVGSPEKVRLLISHRADVNARAKSGRTPLILASAIPGNIEAVKLLLDAGAGVKMRDAAGTGPVWAAAAAPDAKILAELLARGADPNEQEITRRGQTALMNAAAYDSPAAVRVLLNAGADVSRRSLPPLTIKAGLQDRGEMTALLAAAPLGSRETIELLLNAHADPNTSEYRGMNALILAVTSERQDSDVVRLLLKNISDVNAKDKSGLTALDWARKWGKSNIVDDLTRAGAVESASQSQTTLTPEPRRRAFDIRKAVENSVALVQASNRQFFRASGCAGCHHQMLGGMLVGLARQKGLAVNRDLADEQIKEVLAERTPSREALLQLERVGGFPMRDSLLLASLVAQKYPADGMTDALVHILLLGQREDGSWRGHDSRPPLEYSPFSETAYAVRAIQAYAPPGWRAEMQVRIRRAAEWLMNSKAIHTEEKAMQVLGLVWAGADRQKIQEFGRQLVADQHSDGGWAQRPGFGSDAYATGQVLYALHVGAGVPVSNRAWRRGLNYLLETQSEDGSWRVRSRAVKFQPYFESGFPYGHDQWISAAATSWASMALALAVEPPAQMAHN